MSKFHDPVYLTSDQYKDAGNLNARIQLHESFSTNSYGWFRWVFDQFDLSPSAYILEVGCGSGRLWSENQNRIPHGWRVLLSDFSFGMVNGCHAGLADKHVHYSFLVSNVMAIPFLRASFDAVIADHMLYHVPDRPRALSEIARVLKPEGIFYAATNGENHLLELDELIKNYVPEDSLWTGKPSQGFCLENGAIQLNPWFSKIERRDYQDSLVVTEAGPLLVYIHSMLPRWRIQTGTVEESTLEKAVQELIQEEGCMRIQKSSGIFMGRK